MIVQEVKYKLREYHNLLSFIFLLENSTPQTIQFK